MFGVFFFFAVVCFEVTGNDYERDEKYKIHKLFFARISILN